MLTPEEKNRRLQERRKLKYQQTHKIIDGIDYKICDHHHLYFPDESPWIISNSDYFYINKTNGIDGLHPLCKKCSIRKSLLYDLAHPEQKKINQRRWDAKYENVLNRRWYEEKKRERGYFKDYYKKHPEKLKEHNEKRQHKKHNITNGQWNACKEYFNNECAYCGLHISKHYKNYKGKPKLYDLHKEHVDDEGSRYLDNCIPSCHSCNSQKWKYSLDKWYNKENFRFTQERYNKIIKWITEDYKQFESE